MEILQRGIVTLLRSAITGETLPLPEEFHIADAMEQVKRHAMATLIYEGAVRCGVPKSETAMQQLFAMYYKTLVRSEGQLAQLTKIFAAFDEKGIEYLPLKGCNMKSRYPRPELRIMGDADILIRQEQYEQIVPIMESLGFTFQAESDHELKWVNPQLLVELHKRVFPSENKDFSSYFDDGWKLASRKSGGRNEMSAEDEFLYIFAHFARHFRDGGIGCRHVVDLWVYLRTQPTLDMERVRAVLAELGLLEFYDHIRALIGQWFEDGPGDDRTECITDFVFDSGSWGDEESKVVAKSVKLAKNALPGVGGRAVFVWQRFFPPVDVMKRDYPVLRKHIWLLPFVWVYRIFYKVLVERKNLKPYEKEMAWMNGENQQSRSRMLQYVGLDYWC